MKSYEAVEFDYENQVINLFEDVKKNIFVEVDDEQKIKKSFINNKFYTLIFCLFIFGIGFYYLVRRKMKKINKFVLKNKNYEDIGVELL